MSTFTDQMYGNAETSARGLVTGPPDAPCGAAGARSTTKRGVSQAHLRMPGVGPGSAVAVLAGDPADVAPLAQAVWMRGASLTMLQQPTPRTDLAVWLADTNRAATMIRATLTVVGPPFDEAAVPLTAAGQRVATVAELRTGPAIAPLHPDESAVAMYQLTSGSTGTPKAVQITHANLLANSVGLATATGARYEHRRDGHLAAPVPRHGHDRIPHHPDAARHRARRHHRRPIPASPGAVARPDHPLPRHHHLRTQLRLCAARPDPGTRRTGRLRPVQPARRDQRRRTHRRPRPASAGAGGCSLRAAPGAITPAYGMAETTLAISLRYFTGSRSTWT